MLSTNLTSTPDRTDNTANEAMSAPSPPSFLIPRSFNDRLSLPLAVRLPLSTTVGAFSGLLLGLTKGSRDCGLRFQAENAHRLPVTQTGWYLYHKSKNYNMALGGIVEGLRQGVKYSIWVGVFFVLEEGIDRGRAAGGRAWRAVRGRSERRREDGEERMLEVRGSRDCLSSMLAGLGTAGVFSAWNQFPLSTTARTAKLGAKAGLAFGVLQDGVSLLKGRRVGYVEFVQRHTIGTSEPIAEELPV